MIRLSAPNLTWLGDMRLFVEASHVVGQTLSGNRRIVRVTNGVLKGDYIHANVIPGGDDWLIDYEDGTTVQDVRILLRTEDSSLITMTYRGIRTASKDVNARLNSGEEVNPNEYYFRTAPIFETSEAKYDWLNKKLFIAKGIRLQNGVSYSIYQVD